MIHNKSDGLNILVHFWQF